jgi:hypothetical protein
LRLPLFIDFLVLLLLLHVKEPSPQQLHGNFSISPLVALLLTKDANTCGFVKEVDGSFNLIHILPPGTASSGSTDLKMVIMIEKPGICKVRHSCATVKALRSRVRRGESHQYKSDPDQLPNRTPSGEELKSIGRKEENKERKKKKKRKE